jgi:hypothetical protein
MNDERLTNVLLKIFPLKKLLTESLKILETNSKKNSKFNNASTNLTDNFK